MKTLHNQKGSILLTALVLTAVAGVTFLMAQTWQSSQKKIIVRAQAPNTAEMLFSTVVGNIVSDSAWQQSQKNSKAVPPDMHCDPRHSPNSNGGANNPDQSLSLWTAKGEFLLDTRCGNIGFTFSGEPCDSYSSDQGNDSCPFRYEVTLVPGTTDQISGRLFFNPATALFLNTSKYDFQVKRGQSLTSSGVDISTVAAMCARVGGTFSQTLYQQGLPSCTGLLIQKKQSCDPTPFSWTSYGPGCVTPYGSATHCTGSNQTFAGIAENGNGYCGPYDPNRVSQ